MKNSKVFMYVGIILLMIFILWVGFLIIKNYKNNEQKLIGEYTPEAEITDEQLRETNIILYFYTQNSEELTTEIRKIDSKELLKNPEKKLIEFLIEGPQEEELTNLIPTGTKIISIEKTKENLIINFSEEFMNVQSLGKEKEEKLIESIFKTVSQLNEINRIKILINGKENKIFPNNE